MNTEQMALSLQDYLQAVATSTTKIISDHKVTTTSEESTCSMMSAKEHFTHIPSHWIISLNELTKDEIEELWYEYNS